MLFTAFSEVIEDVLRWPEPCAALESSCSSFARLWRAEAEAEPEEPAERAETLSGSFAGGKDVASGEGEPDDFEVEVEE